MGRYNIFKSINLIRNLNYKGFTLVELLVAITMLLIMMAFFMGLINPFAQIQKAQDAQREHNLKEITNALDNYYNDKNCYPISVPFAFPWQVGTTTYMAKVPQDPTLNASGFGYVYVSDNSTCPQWNVLFAKINVKPSSSVSCALENISNCLPQNYISAGYNYCVISGKVNCVYLQSINLAVGSSYTPTPTSIYTPTSPPTSSPTPTVAPSPTLGPGGCYCSSCNSYSIQCFDFRPACNSIGSGNPPPGQYCDPACSIHCQ